ncbi:MAG: hypothetical protein AAGK02_05490 [Pseudomonadota bacterium]
MKKAIFAGGAALLIAACTPTEEESAVGTGPENTEATAEPAGQTSAQADAEGPETAAKDSDEEAADAQVTSASVPAAPEDPDWGNRYAGEIPYYNTSGSAVPAYAEATPDAEVVAQVDPMGGGFIETCAKGLDWCKIEVAETGDKVWVDMKDFGGFAS